MRLLLDSHAFLWWLAEDAKLGAEARQAVADPSSIVHVSAATVWELSIKAALWGSSISTAPTWSRRSRRSFVELPMTARHSLAAAALPRHHDDPFDRMLIAQAQIESLTIITRDASFRAYEVALLAT